MSDPARALLREALSLSDEERADLAAELLASLDEPTDDDAVVVRELWAREIERRARRVSTGGTDGEAWDQVRARVGSQLNGS